ncbi:LANO_0A01618g1_1 [Lachancea nothofagi CBS 11611]|uniref:LANO_0A01618g1_1 n=1 Tax=Lachancea nothofagi CBS 11611 TaxID=1266666 RepID=A0A1G4IMW1_9SACH|nr:LANO_0A01618g1_1 [Lachancea nothofagi CBS 11611]
MADQAVAKIIKPRKLRRNSHRALKACDSCRRMKTRCIPSPLPDEVQCLRCDTLKLRCSFQDLWSEDEDSGNADSSKMRRTSSSTNGSYESAELTKRLLKSGYSPEHFAVHSKLLQNVNKNVSKILGMLEGQSTATVPVLSQKSDDKVTDAGVALANEADRAVSSRVVGLDQLALAGLSSANSRAGSPDLIQMSLKTEQRHSAPYLTCPFTMVSQMVSRGNVPLPIRNMQERALLLQDPISDVIDMELLTLEETTCLMEDFRQAYGQWCSFPDTAPSEKLVKNLKTRNASLLLTTICVLALRYTAKHHDLKTRIYKNLLYKLKNDLEVSLRVVPQTVEFIQAMVLLSMFACSFSSDIMAIDAWYISGIGLQQFLTLSITDGLYRPGDESSGLGALGLPGGTDSSDYGANVTNSQYYRFQLFRLWNHLCLAHITNCVFSGRMCIIDGVRADLCRRTLDFSKSTNFDGRMVAEISLQLILYNFVQQCNLGSRKDLASSAALDAVQDELLTWIEEWRYLLSQPIYPSKQYAEFALDYGHTIVLYTWFHRKFRAQKAETKGDTNSNSQDPNYSKSNDKTSIGETLNRDYPITEVIAAMPLDSQFKMLEHAHRSVEAMINDSFESFRFLSDQLFFQCVHCSLMCLMVAHNLYYTTAGHLREENLEHILSDVKKFSLRLQTIREGELKSFWVEEVDLRVPSVILQYHKAIEACLQEKFPEYEIHVDEDYL